MDFIINILIKKDDLKKINIVEELVEWGVELYSRTPPRYCYDSIFMFEDYYDIVANGFLSLKVLGKYASDLEQSVNRAAKDFDQTTIMKALHEICSLESFAIYISFDDELVKKRYVINNYGDLSNIIKNSFSWRRPEGAMIIKEHYE